MITSPVTTKANARAYAEGIEHRVDPSAEKRIGFRKERRMKARNNPLVKH